MKTIIILGGGESGVGAALLAKKMNYSVFLSDYGLISDHYKKILVQNKVSFEEKGHNIENFEIEFVIKSPGVPDTAPEVVRLRNQGAKIISEIEFGYLHHTGKVLAVTGSNGKTTTSGLLCHFLKTAGYDAEIGGNYGISYAGILAERQPEYIVLELSSFQLDDIQTFKPDISILLNITPDHLDRYGYDVKNYAAAKFRILENQDASDVLIYNADDDIIADMIENYNGKVRLEPVTQTDYINGISSKEGDRIFEMTLKGRHNLFNASCAVKAARLIGLTESQIAEGLLTFKNEAHRLELVATINDVEYINDSKATNVDAVYYALEAMDRDIVWIAGGTDKGNNYNSLYPLIDDRVKGLICLGVDNRKLRESFESYILNIEETQDMYDAVLKATEMADKGDVILLSPACASFDLFDNYIDRGNQFKSAVFKIGK